YGSEVGESEWRMLIFLCWDRKMIMNLK
ncbi:hypothetical protein VCCP1035_0118B, partial [Vibrio cholerae CP1035(8)]